MGKKCVPGVFCIENMTLFMIVVLSISVGYLLYVHLKPSGRSSPQSSQSPLMQSSQSPLIVLTSAIQPKLDDPYIPPLKTVDVRGGFVPHAVMPVNIRTNGGNTVYQQVGILTKNVRDSKEPLILPLMGRSLLNGRDKWQYYTLSNTPGAGINTKLPLSVNGKSCTCEYGCDSISNGDTVYVEGYNDAFRATIYENSSLNYIPV